MTKLSVNINKIATLRNSRGGNYPNVVQVAKDVERFGGQGITVHPRPDERHIRYQDVRDLAPIVTTEFNIEGNPNLKFIDLVLQNKPTQVTLVPDVKHKDFLTEIISEFKNNSIRTSVFVDPVAAMIEGASKIGADRIELYTEAFADKFTISPEEAVRPYTESAMLAHSLNLGINAGHDLSLKNIAYFKEKVPYLLEVSIGHALIGESLYLGLETVISNYLKALK